MKKIIIKTTAILFIVFSLITILALWLLSDGVNHQKEYCSQFIPDLEYYYKKHHEYPESLMAFGGKAYFNFRYSANRCNYERVDKGYIFSTSYSLSFENYESWKKEWRPN